MNVRIIASIAAVVLFSVGVMVWFFIFAKPTPTPSLGDTNNPLLNKTLPIKFQFINNNTDDEPENLTTTEVTEYVPQSLTNIWKNPTTGSTFVYIRTLNQITSTSIEGTTTVSSSRFEYSTSTILMFVDRITGHIYGYDRSKNKTYQISNTTIAGVHDAYIFNNGKNIVYRYPDLEKNTIVGVLATIPQITSGSQAESLQKTTLLPAQVTSVAVSKDNSQLSYLVTNDTGSSVYILDGDKKAVLVATSPFKSWVLSYGDRNILYATSKASTYVEGVTVRLPNFDFIVGGKTGLMSNPGNGGYILNSSMTNIGLKTFFTNGNVVGSIPIATLASKCVWGKYIEVYCAVPKKLPVKSQGLPDDWFQGTAVFDDYLVVASPLENSLNTLFPFEDPSVPPFDMINLAVSDDDNFISFIRKQDGSLWLLDRNLYGE